MAEPARASAADTGTDKARPRRSDPLSPGWANVRSLLCTASEDASMVLADLAERPDGALALRRAELLADRLHNLTEITRRLVLDESIVEAIRADAYAQGVADCRARCGHLRAVP